MKKFLIVIIIILIILLVGQLAYYNIMNSNNEVQNSIVNEENTINQNNEQNVNINDNSIGTETSNEQRRNIISLRNISYIIERYSNEENLNRLLEEFYNFVNTDVNEIYNLINRMSINKILQLYDLNTEEINDMNIYSSEDFLNIVSETLDNGGTVVIPSFAVGRTQEILYEIDKLKDIRKDEEFRRKYKTLMRVPVYVDSPLAISATEVFKENMDLFDEDTQKEISKGENPLEFPGLKFTMTADESKALNEDPTPSIIISASGMCDVGRIKHHLKHNLWNQKSTILFVGYQAPGTLGYNIVNGAKKVKIFGEEIAVNARIEYIEGYSGHADQEGLMNFIYSFIEKPKHIFLVHGEEESQEVLKNKIDEETNLPVTIADFGETYDLSQTVTLTHKAERKIPVTLKTEVISRLEKLKEEMKDMELAVREDMDSKELRDEDVFRINEKIKDLEKQILNVIEG